MSNGHRGTNPIIIPLISIVVPLAIALVAAGFYIGDLGRRIFTLEEEVGGLRKVAMDLRTQVGSLNDQVSAMERPVPVPVERTIPVETPTPSVGPPPGTQINFSNSAPWGSWSDPVYCPEGQYVYGLRQKVEPQQGKGDDTAMNAVAFYCRPIPSNR